MKKKRIFLFGAGDIIPERPPLGGQLFERLSTLFPYTWGSLPNPYRECFVSEGFEAGMELVYENVSQMTAILMRDMALYLIQLRPYSYSSAYDYLITELSNLRLLDNVLFSTLNYDCILEYCLIHHGHRISYWGTSDETVPVWKLHGSSNWFTKDVKAGSGVTFTRGVTFSGSMEASLDIGTVVEKCLVNQGLYPSMCLFMKGKPIQIAPENVEALQASWKDAVMAASSVFCIGVNPLPEDNHIWDSLAATSACLYFVGDNKAFDKWVSENRTNAYRYLGPFFDASLQELLKGALNEPN